MFTGLVQDVGIVAGVREGAGVRAVTITPKNLRSTNLAIGASICCNGICLSVTETNAEGFTVEASPETLARTTLGRWQRGTLINLEPSLRLGDELGGHFVFGHVDAVGECAAVVKEGNVAGMVIKAPQDIMELIAPKGSVAVDGVSLTVNDAGRGFFSVVVIPHTLKVTALAQLQSGSSVNIEADMLARYVARRSVLGRVA